MKSTLSTFLIISFVGVAIFGFLSMVYGDMHYGCIASSMGSLCPLNGAFAFVVFHLNAFKYFSMAILNIALLVLIAGMIFSILPQPLGNDEEEDDFIFSVQSKERPAFLKIKKIIRWFSLKEKSPAFDV